MRFVDDVRFAARTLRRNPAFSLTIIVVVALGIAINLTLIASLETFLRRVAPGVRARDAVAVLATSSDGSLDVASYRDFVDFRAEATGFASLAAWKSCPANVTVGGETTRVPAMLVSAGYFETLGLVPARGRFFGADEDRRPGQSAVAILAHGYWKRAFGGADVVGRPIVINNRSFVIVGVGPEKFGGTGVAASADVFVPMMMQEHLMPGSGPLLDRRGWSGISIVGELRRGISIEQAEANLVTISSRLAAEHPESNEGRGVRVMPLAAAGLSPGMREVVRRSSAILLLTGLATLGLVCASVANLLLARGVGRARELSVRVALGAGRFAAVHPYVAETMLLSLFGGVAGLAMSSALLHFLRMRATVFSALSIGPVTALAAVLLTAFFGLVCSMIPALASRRIGVQDLRGAAAGTGRSVHRTTGLIVMVQVALSIVLLISAGLFLRSLTELQRVAPGYAMDRLFATGLEVALGEDQPDRVAIVHAQVLEQVRAMPGVERAALGSILPLSGSYDQTRARRSDRPSEEASSVQVQVIGTDYFRTLSIPLLRGREFALEDSGGLRSVVVNQALANRFWGTSDPVGQSIRTGDGDTLQVIGVGGNGRFGSLRDEAGPTIFFYTGQLPSDLLGQMTLFIRTSGDSVTFARDLRATLRRIAPTIPLLAVESFEELRVKSLARERALSMALAISALLALILASVGIYGVLSLAVALRRREIGVRVALGASPRNVIAATMTRGARLAAAGVLAGGGVLVSLRGVITPFLYRTDVMEPTVWAVVMTGLAAAIGAASFVPALRASRVDPAAALKVE